MWLKADIKHWEDKAMYKVSQKINYSNGNIMSDTFKCDLPQEAIAWINRGIYKVSKKNRGRILDMMPGEKVKFKMGDCSVTVTCK